MFRCRSCGQDIEWVRLTSGRRMPVDRAVTVTHPPETFIRIDLKTKGEKKYMKKKENKFGWRHGDCLIIKLDNPIETTGKKSDPILALGEISGHSHRLKDFSHGAILDTEFDDSVYQEVWEKLDKSFTKGRDKSFLKEFDLKHLRVYQEAELIHEEHHCFKLPPMDSVVIIQREWQETGWAKVLD